MADVDYEFLIVGAGLSGMCAGIHLRKNGFESFAIIDKANEVGGTWRDHQYPGLTVDVPTIYYSYSFEPNFDWSTFYAPQKELLEYCISCSEKYGLRDHLLFGREVKKAVYDPPRNVWVTHFADGTSLTSRYLISATGYLSVPKLPDIPGVDTFTGKLLHTSAWDKDYDLTGKRIGVIGTGATAVQFVPEIAPLAARLDIYQRTPIWLLPKPEKEISKSLRWALKHIPGLQRVLRLGVAMLLDNGLFQILSNYPSRRGLSRRLEDICRRHIARQVPDAHLREKLTPSFTFGCRRPSLSNSYYATFNQAHVELVTTGIKEITANGIVGADGKVREIDALICATGYQIFQKDTVPTFPVYGADGEELTDFWAAHRYQAYKGVSVAKYPNYFMIFGPYSITSISFISMIENAVRHLMRVVKAGRSRGANYIEVRPEAQAKDLAWARQGQAKTIWPTANCVGAMGDLPPGAPREIPALRPISSLGAWTDSHTFSLKDYQFETK